MIMGKPSFAPALQLSSWSSCGLAWEMWGWERRAREKVKGTSRHSKRTHLQCVRPGFNPWVGKIPWRRAWQPTPVFLPGESPWREKPWGPQATGSQTVGHDWMIKHRYSKNRFSIFYPHMSDFQWFHRKVNISFYTSHLIFSFCSLPPLLSSLLLCVLVSLLSLFFHSCLHSSTDVG